MPQLVSITPQGQMSIPAWMRRELGFNKSRRAVVKKHRNRLIVEPVRDLMEFAGAFEHKAFRDKDIQEVIRIEENAVAEAAAENYRRKKSL